MNFPALKFLGSMASSGGRRESAEAVIDEAAAVSSAPMVKECRRIMSPDGSPTPR